MRFAHPIFAINLSKLSSDFVSDLEELEGVYAKAAYLREKYVVSVEKKGKKLGKQLKNLKTSGFDFFYIYGEDELKDLA